jgi:hypothetical protein
MNEALVGAQGNRKKVGESGQKLCMTHPCRYMVDGGNVSEVTAVVVSSGFQRIKNTEV